MTLDLDAEFEESPVRRGWQPQPWWAWHAALLALAAALVITAGALLATADFGTSLRARACDASPLGGLALLALGCAAAGVGFQLARLHHPAAVASWEWRSVAFAAPLPALLLLATLPGVMGCALGQRIAEFGGPVGDALVGAPGIALAGAGAALLGIAVATGVHVTWQAAVVGAIDDPPGIVELAMREAEALEQDAAAQRFHGVD